MLGLLFRVNSLHLQGIDLLELGHDRGRVLANQRLTELSMQLFLPSSFVRGGYRRYVAGILGLGMVSRPTANVVKRGVALLLLTITDQMSTLWTSSLCSRRSGHFSA